MRQVPEKGDVVTISTNKVTGDKSYSDSVWKVLAVNSIHVKVEAITKDDFWFNKGPRILEIKDYDFSSVDELA